MSTTGRDGERRALVVGIDDYVGTDHDLPSCWADASAAATLLEETYGFEVRRLRDGEATLSGLQAEIARLTDGLDVNDRAVLYYSGHGTRIVKEGVLREALVAQDLELLEDDVLVHATLDLPPGIFTLVLDACFSGGMAKLLDGARLVKTMNAPGSLMQPPESWKGGMAMPLRPFGRSWRPFSKDGAINGSEPSLNGLLLSACSAFETALASTESTNGKSAFTWALLETIAQRGARTPAADLLQGAVEQLRRIDVTQTPEIHDPALPPTMSTRSLFEAADAEPATRSISDRDQPTGRTTMDMNGNSSTTTTADDPALVRAMLAGALPAALDGDASTSKDVSGAALSAPDWMAVAKQLDKLAASNPEVRQTLQDVGIRTARQHLVSKGLAVPSVEAFQKMLGDEKIYTSKGGTVARAFWWGFHIQVSHEDLQAFLVGAGAVTAIVAAIGGGIPSPAAPFIALAAAFIAAVLGILRGLDHGRGVYISMTWFVPGVFVPTSV